VSAAPAGTGQAEGDRERSAGVRRGPDGLEWACVACETYNPMAASTCVVCGTSFTARFADAGDDESVDWDDAFRRNLLLPGLGHMAAGRTGSGIGRALLFGVWLLGWIAITVGGGGRGLTAATPLLAGVVVVYVGSLVDIRRVQHGNPELLAGRTLLWLVVGVTALLMVSTVVAAGVGTSGGAVSL
jgi:hypothetical protein